MGINNPSQSSDTGINVNLTGINGTAPTLGAGSNTAGLLIAFPNDQSLSITGTATVSGNIGIIPVTSGGLLKFRWQVPANVTGISIVTGTHQLYHLDCGNNSAVLAWIKVYDKASAPVVATDTPIYQQIIPGPAGGGGGGFVEDWPMGIPVTLGLAAVVTLAYADTDNTAPTASTYVVNFGYK